MASKMTFHMIPFVFPISAVLIFWMDMGRYTPYLAIAFLILGIVYSMLDIGLLKRAVVTSMINIYVTAFIIIAGGFIFFMMIKSGV